MKMYNVEYTYARNPNCIYELRGVHFIDFVILKFV